MSDNRYAYIDSLRAIAAMLVVWLHASEIFLAPSGGRLGVSPLFDVAYYLDFGRIGVVLFFIISGFVIPGSLKGERGPALKVFAVKRFFRLYPLYWASIPFGVVAMWLIWGKPVSIQLILSNLTMVQSFFGQELIIGLYWTLAVELLFYALCAAMFYFGLLNSERALSAILMFFLIFSFTFFNFENIGHFKTFDFISVSRFGSYTMAYMGFMFLGALLRKWMTGGGLGRAGKIAVSAFIAVWMWQSLSAWMEYAFKDASFDLLKNTIRYNIAIVMFLVMTTIVKLNVPFLAWLGKISYSLYLLHPVVIYSLLWLTRYDAFHGWPLMSYIGLSFSITVALSAASYRYIEKPFIDIGNRLSNKKKEIGMLGASS